MTMLDSSTVLCGVCGTTTEFDEILSTHSIGSSDLDTRSPAMHGIVLEVQVQRCPGCGYCSSDVSVAQPEAQAVIARPEYQDQLNDPMYPKLATSFLCKAILDRESKDFATATWALICASWACDDSDHVELAIACRRKAAEMLILAEEHNQKVAKQVGMSVAILVDLLRRSEQVVQARKVITARRDSIANELIKCILDYQSELLDKNDYSQHRMSEAQSRTKRHNSGIVEQVDVGSVTDLPSDVRINVGDNISFEAPIESQDLQVHQDRSSDESSNTLHTNSTNNSSRSMIGNMKSFCEQNIWFIVMFTIATIAIYMWFDSVQKDRQLAEIKKQERAAFETARISTNNSLLNLAGCMANHASEMSFINVGDTIYKIDREDTFSQEDTEKFNETRNALLEVCVDTYSQKIQDEHGTLTARELNTAFIQVMREEPGVIDWINTKRAIHEATKQVLIK